MDHHAPVVFIGSGHSDTAGADRNLIGTKAFNLLRMDRIGLPVPPAFVLGNELSGAALQQSEAPGRFERLLAAEIRRLENVTGLGFGSHRRPLIVSVRSGAPVSMPGMLKTLLNIGLNERTVGGLVRRTGNPRLAWDSFRRLIASFGEVVLDLEPEIFEDPLARALDKAGIPAASELDASELEALARRYLAEFRSHAGQQFPKDPMEQLGGAVAGVFRSWWAPRAAEYRRLQGLRDDLGTAVIVQSMVFGNAGGRSGSGVAFTRDPADGADRLYVDFLVNAQGEDVVSGRHDVHNADSLLAALPTLHAQLHRVKSRLEREFRDLQDFEFTVQDGELFLLQTRDGKRTPWAALQIAVDLVRQELITPREALERLGPYDLTSLGRWRFKNATAQQPLARAIPASTGVASGHIVFDAGEAEQRASRNERLILVRPDTSTDDIAGMAAAEGILTATGGRTSHAAVVARQLGKACLVGCHELHVDEELGRCQFGETTLRAGDDLSIDAESGLVFRGLLELEWERPDELLSELSQWQRLAGSVISH